MTIWRKLNSSKDCKGITEKWLSSLDTHMLSGLWVLNKVTIKDLGDNGCHYIKQDIQFLGSCGGFTRNCFSTSGIAFNQNLPFSINIDLNVVESAKADVQSEIKKFVVHTMWKILVVLTVCRGELDSLISLV